MSNRMVYWFALAVVALLISPGCSHKPPAPKPIAGTTTFGATRAAYGQWNGRLAVVVWFDHDVGTAEVTSEDGKVIYSGMFAPPKASRLEWNCETANGKSGAVHIGVRQFDLESGGLFLVSTRSGKVRVRQMQPELVELAASDAGLKALSIDDAEIAKFIDDAGKAVDEK